jgi:hypothetical protein
MNGTVLLVAVLICPLVMGTAMLLMWREMRRGHSTTPGADSPSPPEKQAQSHPEMESKRDEAHPRRA